MLSFRFFDPATRVPPPGANCGFAPSTAIVACARQTTHAPNIRLALFCDSTALTTRTHARGLHGVPPPQPPALNRVKTGILLAKHGITGQNGHFCHILRATRAFLPRKFFHQKFFYEIAPLRAWCAGRRALLTPVSVRVERPSPHSDRFSVVRQSGK